MPWPAGTETSPAQAARTAAARAGRRAPGRAAAAPAHFLRNDRMAAWLPGQNRTPGLIFGWFSHGSGRAHGIEDPPSGVEQPARDAISAAEYRIAAARERRFGVPERFMGSAHSLPRGWVPRN
jgi:hypothetical protein